MAEAPPMSLMIIADGSDPSFEKSIDEKYKCLICNKPLKSPVQTECGHRMCRVCVESLLTERDRDTVPCPGKEDNCEPLSITKVIFIQRVLI